MSKLIWDINDGDFLFSTNDNMAFDSDGHMMMRMPNNTAMDMESGELHIVTGWKSPGNPWDDDDDEW